MKNNITELVFVIDMSGSMHALTQDTIGGFNAMIEKQKALPGEVYVTTVLFNTDISLLHDRKDIREIKPMSEADYCAGGCTALLDAMGSSIRHIANIHKYSLPQHVPEHTIFVITTDGMENASRKFTAQKVKEMVSHEQEKYGWEFIFLGANIDAIRTAGGLGIGEDRSVNFVPDAEGLELAYESIGTFACSVRESRPMKAAWKCAVEADHNKRGR